MAFKGNSKNIYFNQIIEQSKFTLPFKAIVCAWKKENILAGGVCCGLVWCFTHKRRWIYKLSAYPTCFWPEQDIFQHSLEAQFPKKEKRELVKLLLLNVCAHVCNLNTQTHWFWSTLWSLWSGAQRPTVAQSGTGVLSRSSQLYVCPLQGGQYIYIKVQPLCACDNQHCLSFDQLWLMLC